MQRLCTICLVTLLLTGLGRTVVAQTPLQWRDEQLAAMNRSSTIMQRANQRKNLLAQYQVMRQAYAADGQRAFRAIFGQYLSWYQTFIGDYKDAELAFSIQQKAQRNDAPSPLTQPGWHSVPAFSYIPKLAKKHRVVFLNESHNIALTRTLTVRLLKPLRKEGFNVFAVETLYQSGIAALNKRGYPVPSSGFYTREPIYAEMVRTALKLGYKVVAYEADANHRGDAREAQQASNLLKILKDNPNAKLVVNAGYAHITETGKFLRGERSMAEHFIADSGLNPLSVEQTFLVPHQNRAMDYPYYPAIIKALHPKQPIVFVNQDGKPWSLRQGYDVSVIFPAQHFVFDRPTWLRLWGLRVPYFVGGGVCHNHYPCMVAARYADEGPNAIPADRMVLDPVSLMLFNGIKVTNKKLSVPVGQLYLRPGHRYRLSVSDASGHVISRTTIKIKAHPGDLQTTQPVVCPGVAATASTTRQPTGCPDPVSQP